MQRVEKTDLKYFDPSLTDRERAVFEGGIALAAIYHQFAGTPISPRVDVVKTLEKAIEKTVSLQPYKTKVKVRIDAKQVRKSCAHVPYCYQSLKGEHLDVLVETRYRTAKARLRMRHIPKLRYTLMYVEKLSNKPHNRPGKKKS